MLDNKSNKLLRIFIQSKTLYNGLLCIISYYDGDNHNNIHNYAIAVIDKIPKLNNEIFKVNLFGFNANTNSPFKINTIGFYKTAISSFFTTFRII